MNRQQVYATTRALANLAQAAGRIHLAVEARSPEGFEPGWLQNAVLEPLDESELELESRGIRWSEGVFEESTLPSGQVGVRATVKRMDRSAPGGALGVAGLRRTLRIFDFCANLYYTRIAIDKVRHHIIALTSGAVSKTVEVITTVDAVAPSPPTVKVRRVFWYVTSVDPA